MSNNSSLHEQNEDTNVVQQDPHSQIPPYQEPSNETRPDPLIADPGDPVKEEEEEEDEPEEVEEREKGMPPPTTEPHLSIQSPNPRRSANKRKKGKGKAKGKPNIKKQQSIDKKVQTLMENLNPIPFIPNKILDFAKHEKLLKRLGLWDFVHIDFDRSIRVDLIAQLVATYESRHSYMNCGRIGVNRAELARAFKIPVKKKEKAGLGVGVVQVDLDSEEVLSEDSIGFVMEFVSDWVLLHEDTWIMPNEVMNWLKVIKEGHPEKVDWAGLIWFMVEKELVQGDKLENCYYASHLQYLMKEQKVFLREEIVGKTTVELNAETNEVEKEEDANDGNVTVNLATGDQVEEDRAVEGLNVELRLGQDGEKEEGMKNAEITDDEKIKEGEEEGRADEQGRWLLNGSNDVGEHFLQRCSMGNGREFGSFGDVKMEEKDMGMEEVEEEMGEEYNICANDDVPEGDELTSDFLQAMKRNQIAFGSQDQFHDPSSMDTEMQHMAPTTSFFNQTGKRVIEHNDVISNRSLNDGNKRLRINDSWDPKPFDFGMCIEQMQQMTDKARIFYEEKEQALEQSNMNQQILLNEVQQRDNMIASLHKTSFEETQKKDNLIYRLERELYIMGNVLDGYRKSLKETQRAFDEYRQRAQLSEESTYKDAGPGGLMLSTAEIERIRKKQEEEYRMNCLIVEQRMKEAEEVYVGQFEEYLEKVNMFDTRLKGLATDVKELSELYAKQKMPQAEEKETEVAETLPEVEEKAPEVAETLPDVEEKVPEAAETLPDVEGKTEAVETLPDAEEKLPAAAETLPDVEDKVPEAAETLPDVEDKVPEAAETLPDVEDKVPEAAETLPVVEEKVLELVEAVLEVEEKLPEVAETLPEE